MADRFTKHALGCLNRAKEEEQGGICFLTVSEVDMIIYLLKEKMEEDEERNAQGSS